MVASNVIQASANFSKDYLVGITKHLSNDSNPGLVDIFMDEAKGRGHRIVTGHDFSNVPEIYEKFGLSGLYDYFKHLSKDVMSPDGIPIPFAKSIQESLGLSTMQSIDWLCLNIGDVLSGGFSLWHTREMILALQAGNLSNNIVLKLLIGSGLKIYLSIHSPNPISLVCGLVDLSALAYYAYPVYSNQVLNFIRPELSWNEIFKNSIQVSGLGFASSFTLRSLQNITQLINKKVEPKRYFKSVAKETAIDGIISGSSSLISDLSEKYFSANRTIKNTIAFSSFIGLRAGYSKLKNIKRVQPSDSLVNMSLIPAY